MRIGQIIENFYGFDDNMDLILKGAEYKAFLEENVGVKRKMLDVDKDGQITFQEFFQYYKDPSFTVPDDFFNHKSCVEDDKECVNKTHYRILTLDKVEWKCPLLQDKFELIKNSEHRFLSTNSETTLGPVLDFTRVTYFLSKAGGIGPIDQCRLFFKNIAPNDLFFIIVSRLVQSGAYTGWEVKDFIDILSSFDIYPSNADYVDIGRIDKLLDAIILLRRIPLGDYSNDILKRIRVVGILEIDTATRLLRALFDGYENNTLIQNALNDDKNTRSFFGLLIEHLKLLRRGFDPENCIADLYAAYAVTYAAEHSVRYLNIE